MPFSRNQNIIINPFHANTQVDPITYKTVSLSCKRVVTAISVDGKCQEELHGWSADLYSLILPLPRIDQQVGAHSAANC